MGYLPKPVRHDELRDCLRTVLGLPEGQMPNDTPARSVVPQLVTRHIVAENVQHRRILVVEDNIVNQTVARGQLHRLGHDSVIVSSGVEALKEVRFWKEYDTILKGFIDFYRTFFTQVSTRNAALPRDIYFPELVEAKLQFNNDFLKTAKMVRDRCIKDAKYANSIRWQPAFKQLIYRNDKGKLIVTISQNSIGNAITELLGVVVKRTPDAEAYSRAEPALIEQLLEVRRRLVEADLGEAVATPYWPA
mgnify:CR=1 FL=1